MITEWGVPDWKSVVLFAGEGVGPSRSRLLDVPSGIAACRDTSVIPSARAASISPRLYRSVRVLSSSSARRRLS